MRIDNLQLAIPSIKDSLKSEKVSGPSFGDFLKSAIKGVNEMQLKSTEMTKKFVTGEIGDIHQVMIASEKAGIALQFTIQIRNRLLESYQEIMRMQM